MGGYLAVSHTGKGDSADLSTTLRERAIEKGLAIIDLSPGAWLGVFGPRPPRTLAVGSWMLVGDVFNRASHDAMSSAGDSYEHKMMARFWGRYIGLRLDGQGAIDAALRDPSGALECATWSQSGVTFVTSEPPAWLFDLVLPEWSIRFERIRDLLQDTLSVWCELPIDGPMALVPGTCQPLRPPAPAIVLWRPADFALRGANAPMDDTRAQCALTSAVDESVAGFVSLGVPLAAEVSGGLDSSIVAASLARSPGADVRLWLNAYGPDRGADERSFARALAEKLKIAPTYVSRTPGLITEEGLLSISRHLRPGLNALDVAHDRAWADLFRGAGVQAAMTGKGGDTVFVQTATADVFSDLWRARGWRAAMSPSLPRLARWNERSVWSLLGQARRSRRDGARFIRPENRLLGARDPHVEAATHPWINDGEGLGPAKLYQIAGLANGLTFQAPSAQTEAVDLFHPLLAQPVVELCLALPTPQLTLGRRDRALARRAFAHRLPAEIVERRSKGEMTAFYGRMIANSLDVLRPWLLDGILARERILDREAAERLLTPEHLIWRGGYGEIMIAAAVEGWLRVWTSRLSGSA